MEKHLAFTWVVGEDVAQAGELTLTEEIGAEREMHLPAELPQRIVDPVDLVRDNLFLPLLLFE